MLIYALIEYFIYKNKSIKFNNFSLSYSISIIIGIILYLIIYLLFNHFLKEKPNPENNEMIKEYNQIVNAIKTLFKDQSIFFISNPTNDFYQFERLQELSSEQMTKQYNENVNEIRRWKCSIIND